MPAEGRSVMIATEHGLTLCIAIAFGAYMLAAGAGGPIILNYYESRIK